MNSNKHISVLLKESIDALNIKPNGIYVDGTLGRCGHFELILKKLANQGILIGIDQDIEAINFCHNKFKNDSRVRIVKDNFSNIDKILSDLKINHVDGIILDLGVSSPQLDNLHRGFSYKKNCDLDMRMDLDNHLTAKEIINNYSFNDLCYIFKIYADENNPKKLVNEIIKKRSIKPIITSFDFIDILKNILPKKEVYNNKNYANKYFQALRIAVNDEINKLQLFLSKVPNLLNKNGRLAIISFHSLEDKIILKKYKDLSKDKLPKEIPLNLKMKDFEIINFKGVKPSEEEFIKNNRSRSAKLRILEKK